jgi:hypothetical protein
MEERAVIMRLTTNNPGRLAGLPKDWEVTYIQREYDPDQPRGDHGRWTSEGGGSNDASGQD